MENSLNNETIITALLFGVLVLFALCIILFVKLYQALQDNATLQYQNACFTAETSQERTFTEIYNDLTKIITEIREVNRKLENQSCNKIKLTDKS